MSSTVLYRVYRPGRFVDITDQTAIIQSLTNQILLGKTAHAYCFSGPRGVGKTTLARVFARALNCSERSKEAFEPCNACTSCMAMGGGNSLDLIEVDAASHTGVDNVRDNIINASRVATAGSLKKVFIIDEAHMLSTAAFNALLKTLEEPPEHVVFILATTEIHKIPETILSRCQRYQFHRIPKLDMVKRLEWIVGQEKRVVEPAVLEEIALRSEGSQRDAETMLGQVLGLDAGSISMELASLVIPRTNESDVLKFSLFLTGSDSSGAMVALDAFVADGGESLRLLDGIIECVRDALTISVAPELMAKRLWSVGRKDAVNTIVRVGTPELLRMLDVLIRRRSFASESPSDELTLQMGILETMLKFSPAQRLEGPEAVATLTK